MDGRTKSDHDGVGQVRRSSVDLVRRCGDWAPFGAARRYCEGQAALVAQLCGGFQRPVRLAQQLARQQHHVGFAAADDVVGLRGAGDQADGAGRDAGLARGCARRTAPGSRARPGSRPSGRGRRRSSRSGRRRASFSRRASATDCSMSQPPSAQSVPEMRTNSGQSLGHAARTARTTSRSEPHAVLERAAVLVGALVAQRREELVQQVAVGGVDLDHPEAGVPGALGRVDEGVDDAVDARGVERLGHRIVVVEGDGAGRDRRPAAGRLGAPGRAPAQGRSVLALRPAWASWMPATAPCCVDEARRCGRAARRARRSRCPGPRGDAALGRDGGASVMTRPAPPTARLPRWTKCQSFARPSVASEYWHMGDTTMRLRKVISRRRNSSNRCDMAEILRSILHR